MRSSRWDANGNIYLVTEEALTPAAGRAEVDETDGILEVHERFPRRTNVQVARRTPDGAIEARVWERGAGETAASGSSAVAIAAAFGDSPVTIRFPGGELTVRFESGRAFLTGPAVRV